MASGFHVAFLALALLFDQVAIIDSSFMKKLHAKVNNGGECVKGSLTGTVTDDVEEEIKNCNAVSPNFSDVQEEWLADLGSQIHLSDWTGVSPVVRKEVRQCSDREWADVVEAITAMQNTMIGDTSEYGLFVRLHQHDVGTSGTRAGPGSWGWHREYLARFEKAMQKHVPGVSLPYWDVALDVYLPYFNSTVIWSDELLGSCGNGAAYSTLTEDHVYPASFSEVKDGQFPNWRIAEPCATSLLPITTLNTSICDSSSGDEAFDAYRFSPCYTMRSCNTKYVKAFNDAELDYVLSAYSTFAEFSYDLCLLDDHDGLHLAVGGTSGFAADKSCAVADPIMWFMHNYLDYIWELFRQKSQTTDLETDYMEDSQILECHRYNSEMTPFSGLKNSDGLKQHYTKYHYTYEESPNSCDFNGDCSTSFSRDGVDPKYLWCDRSVGRCKSRVKVGTTCKHLGDDACEHGSYCSTDTDICTEREQ